ncbi:hypothetical protein Tco_0348386 [Tanacetum coccineum]
MISSSHRCTRRERGQVRRVGMRQAIECNRAVHAELQAYQAQVLTHKTHIQTRDARIGSLETLVATLVAQTSSLQTQLTTALGRIQTLEAREPARTNDLKDAGVTDALAEIEANKTSRNGNDSHDSGTGSRRTKRAAREMELAVGHNATYEMTWKSLMKMLTDKYCLIGEIKKLEIKIWNLKVKGTDVASYTQCFQELTLMYGRMFLEESDQVEKYVGGLPGMIQGSVMDPKPMNMQEAIEISNDLMDQKIRPGEKKPYRGGSKPLCPKYNYHHDGQCAPKCTNCKRTGHFTQDHRSQPAITPYSVMSDSDESGITYTEVSSPFKGLSDIGSPRADDHEYLELPGMPEDPYVEAALQAPPSPDYVPGLKEPEQAPPSSDYVPGPEHADDEIVAEDQPYAKDASPTAQSPDFVSESDPKDGSSEDDEDEDMDIEADDEEEEEHLAPTDSVVFSLPATDQAPSAEETEKFETDESAATPPPHPAYRVTARISIPAPVPTPGAPVSTDTELGRHMTVFETRVRQDTDEIYTRLDDEQSQRQLLAGRLNMLFRDRRAHVYIRIVTTLQGQVTALRDRFTALQGQQGPVGGPAQPELPEEAGSSS